jgi:hypothetical protein
MNKKAQCITSYKFYWGGSGNFKGIASILKSMYIDSETLRGSPTKLIRQRCVLLIMSRHSLILDLKIFLALIY